MVPLYGSNVQGGIYLPFLPPSQTDYLVGQSPHHTRHQILLHLGAHPGGCGHHHMLDLQLPSRVLPLPAQHQLWLGGGVEGRVRTHVPTGPGAAAGHSGLDEDSSQDTHW